jgi:uncharacterized cysteine cluster protein YcgN (CxxCxxCC family)
MSDFWKEKTFKEMSESEWESLCDGCGKCCLSKFIENEDTKELFYTNIACKLLDAATGQCSKYNDRFKYVSDCQKVDRDSVSKYYWLPTNCAYRLLSEGKPLPSWHHLLTGSRDKMHELGLSVRNKIISEELVHPADAKDYIVLWAAQ